MTVNDPEGHFSYSDTFKLTWEIWHVLSSICAVHENRTATQHTWPMTLNKLESHSSVSGLSSRLHFCSNLQDFNWHASVAWTFSDSWASVWWLKTEETIISHPYSKDGIRIYNNTSLKYTHYKLQLITRWRWLSKAQIPLDRIVGDLLADLVANPKMLRTCCGLIENQISSSLKRAWCNGLLA